MWSQNSPNTDSVAGEVIDGYLLDQIHSLSMYVDVLDPVCSLNSWCLVVEFDLESSHVFHMTHMLLLFSLLLVAPIVRSRPIPTTEITSVEDFVKAPLVSHGFAGVVERGI